MNSSHPFRLAVLAAALAAVVLVAAPTAAAADGEPIFQQDFSKVTGDQLPDDFLVLDGQFAAKEEGGNRFLELPGAPLESFGVLFGPNKAADVQVEARIFGTKTGRKFPTFAVGLNGVGGFKVRVAPAKNGIELLKGDEVLATAPFNWKSGAWTRLKLQVKKAGTGLQVQGKAWQDEAEPADWPLKAELKDAIPAGKAGVWGMPFSGTPIRFDDLKLVAVP